MNSNNNTSVPENTASNSIRIPVWKVGDTYTAQETTVYYKPSGKFYLALVSHTGSIVSEPPNPGFWVERVPVVPSEVDTQPTAAVQGNVNGNVNGNGIGNVGATEGNGTNGGFLANLFGKGNTSGNTSGNTTSLAAQTRNTNTEEKETIFTTNFLITMMVIILFTVLIIFFLRSPAREGVTTTAVQRAEGAIDEIVKQTKRGQQILQQAGAVDTKPLLNEIVNVGNQAVETVFGSLSNRIPNLPANEQSAVANFLNQSKQPIVQGVSNILNARKQQAQFRMSSVRPQTGLSGSLMGLGRGMNFGSGGLV